MLHNVFSKSLAKIILISEHTLSQNDVCQNVSNLIFKKKRPYQSSQSYPYQAITNVN